jgi:PAS domain S-box-containing protein
VTDDGPLIGSASDVLEQMAEAYVALDRDWRVVYMNPEAERINGKPRDAVLGKTHWEEWPASVGTEVEREYRRVMDERVAVHFEYHYVELPDHDVWIAVHAYPIVDGGIGIYTHDITQRRQAEERAKRLLAMTAALSGSGTLADAARVLVDGALEAVGATGGSLAIATPDGNEFEIVYAVGMPEATVARWRRFPRTPGRPLSDAVTWRKPVLLPDSAAWEAQYPEMAPAIRATGFGALAVVPVSNRAGAAAGLTLLWRERHPFDDATRDFLATLGELCGQALERARLYEAERVARREAEEAVARVQTQAVELEQALEQSQTLAQELEITAEQAQETALEAQAARAAAEASAVRERVLARLGGVLADMLESTDASLATGEHPAIDDQRRRRDATLQRMVDVVVPELASWSVIDLIEPGRRPESTAVARRVAMAHAEPQKRRLLEEMAQRYPPDPSRPTLSRRVLETGRSLLIEEVTDDVLRAIAVDAHQVALARGLGMRSAISVPLIARGSLHGVIVLVAGHRRFTSDDLVLAEEIGRRAALAVDNARLLMEAEHRRADLEAVLEVVPVGIGIARDPDCLEVRVNPAFASQLGMNSGDNASKSGPDAEALPFRVMRDGAEVAPDDLPMQTAARERRTVQGVELDVVHADGRVIRLLEYAAPLLDEAGSVRGAVGAFVDITDRARLAAAERHAREIAEETSTAKTHLLSILSHELRTPVNSVLAHAQLIEMELHGPVTTAQRDALRRINRSAQHLTALISDLLNLARIEQGRLQYDLRDVGVREALDTLGGLLAPQATEKGLALAVESIDAALTVHADVDRLQQILLNLVGNAIKFTESGGRISLRATTRDDVVWIDVTDTGPGIPADQREAVFDRFVQVDPSLTRRAGGLGLGLSISRDLARGMGGDLTVESTLGVGSTFTVTLPKGAPLDG